jgi:K+-transporting ATPase ATPase C chain
MGSHLRANLWLLGLTVLSCCVLYPLLVWGIGQGAFPAQAEGSLVYDKDGKPVGSRLITQPFKGKRYFHPRPSAVDYNAAASGGSNLAASNPALHKRVSEDIDKMSSDWPADKRKIPADLVMTSGSGLDPHITLSGARFQLPRVAKARGKSLEQIDALIVRLAERPLGGLAGDEPLVNVLELNRELDGLP